MVDDKTEFEIGKNLDESFDFFVQKKGMDFYVNLKTGEFHELWMKVNEMAKKLKWID